MAEKTHSNTSIESLFKAGVHFGRVRSRRHPSAKPFIFGEKNKVEIFDLEKTEELLNKALEAVAAVGEKGGLLLMVGGKTEAKGAIHDVASRAGLPYVAGRFLGGTLTNFGEIKKRINRMESLMDQKDKGELGKYTKKERLLIDREIDKLKINFSGLAPLKGLPAMMFVADPRKEAIAVAEARVIGIPVVALAGSDCNMKEIAFPIPGNDALESSIRLIAEKVAEAYAAGKKRHKEEKKEEAAQ